MARANKNRKVEEKSVSTGTIHTDTPFNGPAIESQNARTEQVGTFRKANVGASATAVVLTIGGVDADAAGAFVAGRAGVITGIAWLWTTVPTAGTTSLQAAKNGTAIGDTPSVLAVKGIVDQAAEIPFAEGDSLDLQVTTNAGFTPTTDDIAAWLMIRWAA